MKVTEENCYLTMIYWQFAGNYFWKASLGATPQNKRNRKQSELCKLPILLSKLAGGVCVTVSPKDGVASSPL